MKRFFFILIPITVSLFSCKKVVDFKLNETDPKIVIEGSIVNTDGPYFVTVSKSQHFNEVTEFIGIVDALITISDDVGDIDTLKMIFDGIYQTNSIIGTPGRTYFLDVNVNGQTFSSSSTMPLSVNLDTLMSISDPTTISGYALIPVYHDPPGVKNFYRFNSFEGNSQLKLVRVRDDNSTDGALVKEPVGFENYFNEGDSAKLELWCIDEKVYNYFFSLGQTLSSGLNAPASPGNPVSNINGGCLGYFSAHTVQSKSLVIN